DWTGPGVQWRGVSTAECSTALPAPYASLAAFTTAGGSASDNCSGVNAASFEFVSDGALVGTECNGTITRTYRVRDNCGNPSTCKIGIASGGERGKTCE